ncbi:hypothetical protein [Gayadomonas joobiniege]|uniref:hypothetical protein n=1 Tax=Gayadomonas joobiniege TaxID=1234606 RepID=UPI0012DECCAF|nr:hypothetical protein [Gayadomonas joobiniege]
MLVFVTSSGGQIQAQEADIQQCIRYQPVTTVCHHAMIRSIETDDKSIKNKALCICLSDLPKSLQKNQLDKSQLSAGHQQVLFSLQQKYQINSDDLIELITGQPSLQLK